MRASFETTSSLATIPCTESVGAVHSRAMYAIAFDMDTEKLKAAYPKANYTNAYHEIAAVLSNHEFTPQQGSVYFGDKDKVNAVTCVLAIMDLAAKCAPWFAASVRDVRMLRIEDNNDLMPAVMLASKTPA